MSQENVEVRARAWRNALHASVCDVLEPWAHGTVVRATSRPTYWAFNVVRVEEDPAMSVGELAAFADQALAGLAHRRVDFDLVNAAEPLRAGVRGARTGRPPASSGCDTKRRCPRALTLPSRSFPTTRYTTCGSPRHREDFPDRDSGDYRAHAREVSLRPRRIGSWSCERLVSRWPSRSSSATVQRPRSPTCTSTRSIAAAVAARRLTRAAVDAAGGFRDLWITADAEDRPKASLRSPWLSPCVGDDGVPSTSMSGCI